MSTFTQVSTNTLSQAIGKAVSVTLSLLATALLTRHLGQAGYGQYTLITTIVIFFGSITDWGTGFIAARLASQSTSSNPLTNQEHSYSRALVYGNLLLLKLLLTLIGAPLLVLLTYLGVINLPVPLVFIASLILFTLVIRNTIQVVFQVSLQLHYSAIVEILTSLFFLLMVYLSISVAPFTIQQAIVYLLIATAVSSVIGLLLALKLSRFRLVWHPPLIKLLLREALPMGTLLVVFSIYNRLDTFLLQYFQGDQAVGIYGLAYKIHDHTVMGAAFFMNALYPLIAVSSTRNSKLKTRNLFSTGFHLLLLTGLAVAAVLAILAPTIVLILGGPDYLPSIVLVRILVFATAIAYLNHLTGYTMAALGFQRTSLKIAVTALALNLILNFIFIPFYSYYASAVITIFTEGLVFVLSVSYLHRIQQLSPSLSQLPLTIRNLIFHRRELF